MGKLSSPFLQLILLLFVTIIIIPVSCRRSKCAAGKHAALFMFGDSLLDSGNNNYINTSTLDQANFWPYGQTHFHYPTGRFSDGRLISDFIGEFAKLPLIPAFMEPGIRGLYHNGVNFASAGAGALVETFQGFVISVETQLRNMRKVESWLRRDCGNVGANKRLSRAVYFLSIGTNDYISPFLLPNSTILHSSFSTSQYVNMVIGNFTSTILELYGRGGRKFGLMNLGPLGCFPGLRILHKNGNGSGGCCEEASVLAKLHNKALSKSLSKLENELPDFRYSLYDFHTNLINRINHPSKYGMEEGKSACCGTGEYRGIYSCGGKRPVKEFDLCHNPLNFVFWDSYHLTESIHRQMAFHMWTATRPYSFKALFQSL